MIERGHKGALTDLTAEYVRELFDYNSETGALTWKMRTCSRGPDPTGRPVTSRSPAQTGARLRVGINFKRYLVHRIAWLIMTGEWPTHEVDHINGDGTDNRWDNLREATSSENLRNRGAPRHNTSGFKGVSRSTRNRSNPWVAYITHQKHRKVLGYFPTPEEAHARYREEAKRLHGEFVRTE